jgi:hypothetical protein
MTRMTTIAVALAALTVPARDAAAQQPPRPTDTSRSVMLPLPEYNRLIDLANRPPQASAAPPVAAVLASADLRVRVDRDTARGTFNLTGEMLRSGINRVTLLSGATVLDATTGGRPLPMLADGDAHAALLPGPGPFAVALEWGAALSYTPGRASFVLPVPPSGTARATIDLPGDQADVNISTGLITRRSIANGRTIVEATLDPGTPTEFWWSMRDSAPVAAARDTRTLADISTLVTLGDSDVKMVALIDLTVVQGEPRTFEVRLPPRYELTSISGSSLEGSEPREGSVVLAVNNAALRRHQFLISLEGQHEGGSFSLDTGVVALPAVQRERGEIAVEGVGTLELTVADRDGLHRMDVRELGEALQSLARMPILSAFRYQHSSGTPPGLSLQVKRFSDAGVLAAVADRAVATTLVTTEGRALTEIALTIQNRAQPFLKVTLPEGATIVSVDVAGQPAKPVLGADGTRVPLLRPGFRPAGAYPVTFVYLHAGTPFASKGEMQMRLPRMDMPIGIVEWEVFAPENYSLRTTDGNVIDRRTISAKDDIAPSVAFSIPSSMAKRIDANGARGQIRGRATDVHGAALPGAAVTLEMVGGWNGTVVTDSDGTFAFTQVPSGRATITVVLQGFSALRSVFEFSQDSQHVDVTLQLGALSEAVTVDATTSPVQTPVVGEAPHPPAAGPSQNVLNLQRRAAGVLPVRVDVPRAGTSHRFVKPLLVDQEASVGFRYKRRSVR